MMSKKLILLAALLAATSCSGSSDPQPQRGGSPPTTPVPLASLPAIDAAAILERTKALSADTFEGRAPGTRGEDLTVKYLEDEFRKLGLQPGNTDGTFIQKVPLVGITAANTQPLTITKNGRTEAFTWGVEVVAWSKHVADSASIRDSDVLFAGYGVTA
jgi:hypothetical protein